MSFPYKHAHEIRERALELGLHLPWSERTDVLKEAVLGQGFSLPNALCAQPMEGNDALEDGAPSSVTIRRYEQLAKGGSGLIWLEAVAVSKAAQANPRQLMITRENMPVFALLRRSIDAAAQGAGFPAPVVVMQFTHSGRNTTAQRVAASHHKVMNPHQGLPMDYPIITDEELLIVQQSFAQAGQWAREAGYDGVDIKACHLYLFSELLGATSREGAFGTDYAGRTRMIKQTIALTQEKVGRDYLYAVRINMCDAMTDGFGTDGHLEPDMREAIALCKELYEDGVSLFNTTMGTPYYNPHVNRPYASHPATEGYDPPEDPLRGVARLLSGNVALQRALPQAVCVATGFSYLRHFAPQVAAGLCHEGGARAVGFGRGWMAYPNYAADILRGEGMQRKQCCLTCGLCTFLMRRGEAVGCPVRDEAYRAGLRRAQALPL